MPGFSNETKRNDPPYDREKEIPTTIMPTVHNSRKKNSSSSSFLPRSTTSTTTIKSSLFPLVFVCVLLFVLILSLAVFPSSNNNNSSLETNVVRVAKDPPQQHSWKLAVQKKREQVAQALQHLTAGKMPSRLRSLRDHHQIVGERLVEVKQGKETVQEILHGHTVSVCFLCNTLSRVAVCFLLDYCMILFIYSHNYYVIPARTP